HAGVLEVDSVLREAQPLSFVAGEKLRVEHGEVNPLVVFPILGNEHVVHVKRPSHRSCRWLGLKPNLDDMDDLRQRHIRLRAQMRYRRAVCFSELRGYDLYGGYFRWFWWLHNDTSNGSESVGTLQISHIHRASRSPIEYKSDGAKIGWVHTTLDEPLDRKAQRLHHDFRGTERRRIGIQ